MHFSAACACTLGVMVSLGPYKGDPRDSICDTSPTHLHLASWHAFCWQQQEAAAHTLYSIV